MFQVAKGPGMATPPLALAIVLMLVGIAGGEEQGKGGGGGLGVPALEATRGKELSVKALLGERKKEGGGPGEYSLGEARQRINGGPSEHSLYHGESSDQSPEVSSNHSSRESSDHISGEPSDHLRDESHPLVTLLETSPHTMKLLIRPWSYKADTMVGSEG